MSTPPLPPQAYTRDTVIEAFNWLQTQPESVRQLAKSEDALVSLYLRAKRFGGVGSPLEQEAPVSSKKFKTDLKSLAKGLKDFDEGLLTSEDLDGRKPPTQPAPTQGVRPQQAKAQGTAQGSGHSPGHNPGHNSGHSSGHGFGQEPRPSYQLGLNSLPPPIHNSSNQESSREFTERLSLQDFLDPISHRQLRRAMDTLNLSSEVEALRLLITVGSQRIQKMLD